MYDGEHINKAVKTMSFLGNFFPFRNTQNYAKFSVLFFRGKFQFFMERRYLMWKGRVFFFHLKVFR